MQVCVFRLLRLLSIVHFESLIVDCNMEDALPSLRSRQAVDVLTRSPVHLPTSQSLSTTVSSVGAFATAFRIHGTSFIPLEQSKRGLTPKNVEPFIY